MDWSVFGRRWPVVLLAGGWGLLAPQMTCGQGGEPRTFAIRGAKAFPVSSAPLENATIVVSKGLITAVGANVTIPPDAWMIDGKGLLVYPGLFDAFTDVGLMSPPAPPADKGEKQRAISRGPEDRPETTPWRKAEDEVNASDPRVESWRSAGFTTVVAVPKGGMFPGQAAILDLGEEQAAEL